MNWNNGRTGVGGEGADSEGFLVWNCGDYEFFFTAVNRQFLFAFCRRRLAEEIDFCFPRLFWTGDLQFPGDLQCFENCVLLFKKKRKRIGAPNISLFRGKFQGLYCVCTLVMR